MAQSPDGPVPYGPPQGLDGLTAGLTAGLGGAAVELPNPSTVARLAPGPRPVPTEYRLACFDLKLFELIALGSLALVTIPLSGEAPRLSLVPLTIVAVLFIVFRARRYRRRTSLLRWGEVATVTAMAEVAGVLHSSTTYSNVRLRSARGWSLDTSWYTGRGYTVDVTYALPGTEGTVRVRGRRYEGGVVLADPRDPGHGLCVSAFSHELTPGPDGQWPGGLPGRVWAGILVTLASEIALLVATGLAWITAFG